MQTKLFSRLAAMLLNNQGIVWRNNLMPRILYSSLLCSFMALLPLTTAHAFATITAPGISAQQLADAQKGCRELYRETNVVNTQLNAPSTSYWNNPRNQAAVAAGLVITPAFYYLGYSATRSYLNSEGKKGLYQRLDQLRSALADQRCFVN